MFPRTIAAASFVAKGADVQWTMDDRDCFQQSKSMANLGGRLVINDHGNIESAIAQAQRYVDDIW